MQHRLEQVTLRKPEPCDVGALWQFKNDPGIAASLGGFHTGLTRAAIERWIEDHASRSNEVMWAIVDNESESCLGHAALYDIDHRVGASEFGILIGDRRAQGRGIGTTVTRFAVEYAFAQLRLHRVFLTVLVSNHAAVHVYEKVGFAKDGVLRDAAYSDGSHHDMLVMSVLQHEYTEYLHFAKPPSEGQHR